jgi:hypothetical protein
LRKYGDNEKILNELESIVKALEDYGYYALEDALKLTDKDLANFKIKQGFWDFLISTFAKRLEELNTQSTLFSFTKV